jgi:hypothetical protein
MMTNFELVFFGGAIKYMPRYRRNHKDIDSAKETARKVWVQLQANGYPTACHTAIVYGPGCGRDGRQVNPW